LSEDFPALSGFRAGSLVAGYRLEAQVGAGGMAVVFRARDERLGRLVALKILAPAMAADGAFRRRFIAESRAAAAVDDPHIIPVYEAGEAVGVLFIAMRFVKGGDLRLVLEREGILAGARAVAFISPVASALDAAHGAGLVHRDVKPANILVDARPGRPDHVYLSDFGVSKGAMSSVSLTGPGQFLGTPAYSAPEQIQGRIVDGRTDQYALACVAYQLLTGTAPFERDQGMAVLLAHLSEPPPSLSSQRPDLPATADQVLAKGMAKAPEKRYGSCSEFANALQEALGPAAYSSRGFPFAPDRPETAAASRPELPGLAAAGTGRASAPADQAATATIDSETGSGLADRAISASAASARPTSWPARKLAGADETGSLARGRSLTGEPGQGTADGPASTANVGDARLGADADKVDLAGATPPPPGMGVIAWAAQRLSSISNLMSRLLGSEQHVVADEKGPDPVTVRARRSHRAEPRRARRSGRRRWPIVTTSLVVLLAVVAGGGYIAWRWSQDQYYVGADSKGEVVIYRGINEKIAGLNLSRPYQLTGIQLAQVPLNDEQTVKTAYASGSLAQVQRTVGNIRTAVAQCHLQYANLQTWVSQVKTYQRQVAQARLHKQSTKNIPQPGPQPPAPGGMCAPAAAFGIAAADLVAPAAGAS